MTRHPTIYKNICDIEYPSKCLVIDRNFEMNKLNELLHLKSDNIILYDPKNGHNDMYIEDNSTLIIKNAFNILNYQYDKIKQIMSTDNSLILIQDFPELVNDELRNKFDYIIIGTIYSKLNMKRLYNWYLKNVYDYETFKNIYNELNSKNQYLIINFN